MKKQITETKTREVECCDHTGQTEHSREFSHDGWYSAWWVYCPVCDVWTEHPDPLTPEGER